MDRDQPIQTFIKALRSAFNEADENLDVTRVSTTLFRALQRPGARGGSKAAALPVNRYFHVAREIASNASLTLSRLAEALAKLEPEFHWAVRPSGGANSSSNWPGGHANAMIIGPGGLEERSDVAVGVSLLAPNVRYPDHNHGPEEIYLVLTPGLFQHGTSGWFEPGPGGTLHNVPNIQHAIASGSDPLLAVWCLLMKVD